MTCGRAATNMLAISFSRRDKKQASAILSDAIAIAAVLGCCLAVAMYFYAPPALRAINGAASAELVQPAITYVRWRCALYYSHPVIYSFGTQLPSQSMSYKLGPH